jgi:glycosyltransferase involved in cell wall biosynthesis
LTIVTKTLLPVVRQYLRRQARRGAQFLGYRAIDALRFMARRRLPSLKSGAVTVVTVNWNSVDYLRVLVAAVRRFSPPEVRILVVDNGSRDASRGFLADRAELSAIYLPFNLGHAAALDIGFLCARTEFVVALDIDAFPLRDDWLERLIGPLRQGYTISGARLNREYVHPCCLAMRLARFVERRHSFKAHYVNGAGDVGELMAWRDGGPLNFIDPTSQRGPGDVGTVFGDLVYHNFYATRFARASTPVLDQVVGRDHPAVAWHEALAKYLGQSI